MASTEYTTPSLSASVTRMELLPAAAVQSHASNLLPLPDGTLLCAWFGGTQEGISDISIFLSRRPPGPSSPWTDPVRVSSDPTRSEQNPVLFRDPATGMLWLFHTAQPAGNQDEAVVVARTSWDDGRTWADAPFPRIKGLFVRQPVVVLPDPAGGQATWVLPVWHCRVPPEYRWVGSDDVSAVLWTRDGGATWTETAVPESVGAVHMAIVQWEQSYVAFFRSRWADRVYRATSEDGIYWSAPEKTCLPNPNSGIAAAALASRDIVLVFNNSAADLSTEQRLGLYDDIAPPEDTRTNQPGTADGRAAVWGTPRKALSIGLSKDGGVTWKCRVLEDGDGWCMSNSSRDKANRELSYPSVALMEGRVKGVHVSYTWHRQGIKCVCIEDVEEFLSS